MTDIKKEIEAWAASQSPDKRQKNKVKKCRKLQMTA